MRIMKALFGLVAALVLGAFVATATPSAAPFADSAAKLTADGGVELVAAKKKAKKATKKKKKKGKKKKGKKKGKAGSCGTMKYWDKKKKKCVDARDKTK